MCDLHLRLGGHGGGRGDITGTLKALNTAGKKRKPPVTFVAQPSRSPDFNALDLGAWWSLAAGVPATKATKNKKIHKVCNCLNRFDQSQTYRLILRLLLKMLLQDGIPGTRLPD